MAFIVAHPDTQHSLQAARALKRAGLLRCLFTSFSLQRPGWMDGVVRRFAPDAYARLSQHRAHGGLDPAEIRVFPAHFVAQQLGPRWSGGTRTAFSRAAGRLARREGCGVLAFNSNAVHTFRILANTGLPRVLDQSIAHRRWRELVGRAEVERFGDWATRWDSYDVGEEIVRLEDEEVALADLVVCGSEFCAGTMEEHGVPRGRLAVAEYGADTERFVPRTEPKAIDAPVRLLFVGALVLRKGIPYLLEAVKRLSGLGVKVTLAGNSALKPEALGRYADVIEASGHRLHEEMPALYRDHDAYVFPSLIEGSSLSIYEALASGLPVVTTPNAGSIVRDGVEGFVVPTRDVDALAGAIERLVRDRDLRLEMGRAARQRATSFGDWSHYGERLVAALRRFS